MWRRAWARAGIGVAVGLAVAAFAAWYFVVRDVAEPATVGEAVKNFRENPATRVDVTVPVGVYVYDTKGLEKTDALTDVTHRYPARSTITVTSDPCGIRMRWDVLKGRSTVWTFCIDASGWALESQDERHTFFGRTEHTDYDCGHAFFRLARARLGSVSPVACGTVNADERGEARVLGVRTLRVAHVAVSAVALRKTSSFTGAIRGTSTYDFWLERATGIPVRIAMESRTTNDSPVGDVHYEEDVTLRLTSLTPRR